MCFYCSQSALLSLTSHDWYSVCFEAVVLIKFHTHITWLWALIKFQYIQNKRRSAACQAEHAQWSGHSALYYFCSRQQPQDRVSAVWVSQPRELRLIWVHLTGVRQSLKQWLGFVWGGIRGSSNTLQWKHSLPRLTSYQGNSVHHLSCTLWCTMPQ